jgi:hypothetical protein
MIWLVQILKYKSSCLMSTDGAKMEGLQGNEVFMVPLDLVVMIAWDKKYGDNLRTIRGKVSRRAIASGVESRGVECSQEYIRKLEQGLTAAVSTKIIVALAKTLDVELVQIIPGLQVTVSSLFALPVANYSSDQKANA